jgi:hypothetical protein
MKCEKIKIELPGLLWGELNEEEHKRVLEHISVCETCREEWKGLKSAEAVMQELKEVAPQKELQFITAKANQKRKTTWEWIFRPGVLQWGIATGLILIALWISKPNFSYQDGQFKFAFGRSETVVTTLDTTALAQKLQAERIETLKLVSTIMKEQSEEQRRDFTITLAAFARDLERQRQEDLNWVGMGLKGVERNSQANFMKTNMILEGVLRNASFTKSDTMEK